jgi:predicted RNase H-like nuclease (RuvC/YqgF family)
MLKLTCILLLLLSATSWAQKDFGYLQEEDQKFFKNESMAGNNQLERIDINVKEINKLHAEVAMLKAQLQQLKADIAELKAKKP